MNLTVKRLDLVRKVGIVQTEFWWFAAFFSGKVPLRGPTAHQTSNLMKGMDALQTMRVRHKPGQKLNALAQSFLSRNICRNLWSQLCAEVRTDAWDANNFHLHLFCANLWFCDRLR
jgi:hypothetical protein